MSTDSSLTFQTRYPAAIMRLLYYPARTAEQAEELEPGIGVSLHLTSLESLRGWLMNRVTLVGARSGKLAEEED